MAASLRSGEPSGRDLLRLIGNGLDDSVWPGVARGGRLVPAQPITGNEAGSAKEAISDGAGPEGRSAGPATGSREGTAGRRTSERSSSPDQAAPIFRQLSLRMASELDEVVSAYPQVQIEITSSRVWLTANIRPIRGLFVSAKVATLVSLDQPAKAVSWARWNSGARFGRWIGPRHTYADGSICAFDIGDAGWDAPTLRERMDAIALWIARQIFLAEFGRWPGPQVMKSPAERLFFQAPAELCGACDSGLPYSRCHQDFDLKNPGRDPDRDVAHHLFRMLPREITQRLGLQADMERMTAERLRWIRRRSAAITSLIIHGN